MSILLRGAVALLALLSALAPAQADWQPTERINYLIGVAPGGSSTPL